MPRVMEPIRLSSIDPYMHNFDLSRLDDGYHLLQLCQKNDWRNVERLCDVISNSIPKEEDESPDNDNASERAFVRVGQARMQLETMDQWGNTALHLVCYSKPPAYVVSAILIACKLVRDWCDKYHDPSFVLHPNHQGATPLLIACQSGACQEVLQLLMQGDSRALFSRDHQAVSSGDHEGNTAFTGLVQRYSMLCKIPQYKRYCTSLYARINNTTTTSTHDEDDNEDHQEGNVEIIFDGLQFGLSTASSPSCTRMPWDNDQASDPITYWMPNPSKESFHSPGAASHKRNQNGAKIFPELWENISLLLDAAWNDSLNSHTLHGRLRQLVKNEGRNSKNTMAFAASSSTSWLDHPIHATALVADALPTSIIDLLLRLHYHDWCKSKDNDAVHPIHFAVTREEDCRHTNIAAMRRQSHIMERLLAMDPSSARRYMHNANRFVFHQAIASGLTWHVAANGEPGPVEILFRAAPEMLTKRDGETGLFPFQIAAAAAGATSCCCCPSESQQLQVDTIFQLLRKAPEVLTHDSTTSSF